MKQNWSQAQSQKPPETVVGTRRMFQLSLLLFTLHVIGFVVVTFICNHKQRQTTNHKPKQHVTRDTTHTQTRNTHTHKTTEDIKVLNVSNQLNQQLTTC